MDSAHQPFNEASSGASTASLHDTINTLKSLLVTVILASLILTGSFFVFLLREVTLVRRQITEQAQYIGEFEKSMDDLRSKLQSFARTNSDFNPIFVRYFGTNPPPPVAPVK